MDIFKVKFLADWKGYKINSIEFMDDESSLELSRKGIVEIISE
ncbi:TPA_asm: hypothetical protein [Altiarchaeum virus]|nr:TPA_asm: hypothetical protein [Altiarchaeum virus]